MANLLKSSSYCQHKNPKKLIIMLHGYGDHALNFIQIASLLDKVEWKIKYIALNAPNHIIDYPMGYEWFNLYPNGVYIRNASNDDLKIVNHDIDESINKLIITINHHVKLLNLKISDCIILGFSQGGMMTYALGNYVEDKFAGLAILSGRIFSKNKITNKHLIETPIFISHGAKDDVIPIEDFNKSVNFLKENKCNFESYKIDQDTHTISENTINLLQKFIKKYL